MRRFPYAGAVPHSVDSSIPLRPAFGAPSVLLLHPDPARRRVWASYLVGYRLQEAESWEAARERFKASEIHVVVCPWPWAREHLPEQVQHDGVRILYVGPQLPDEVVEDAAAGHRVGFVSRDEALAHKLTDLVWPLRLEHHRHVVPGLRVVWAGLTESSHQVSDLSPGGFSFELPSAEPIEPFVPGSILTGVRFVRHGRVCIQGVPVEVRHLSALAEGYRVGCSFRTEADSRLGPPVQTLQDPVKCLALVRTALRRGALRLDHPEGDTLLLRGGNVDLPRHEFRVNHPLWDIPRFEVVRFTFESAGGSYTFATSLLEAGEQPVFRAPALIEERFRRRSERRLIEGTVEVRLEGPLFDKPVSGRLVDLSTAGLSMVVSDRSPVAPGAFIDRLRLQLGDKVLGLRAQITHCLRLEGSGGVRLGIRFKAVSDEDEVVLTRFLMAVALPTVEDGEKLSFDELFELFSRTHLLKDDYIQQLRPSLPVIRQTFERLGREGGTLFKALMLRHQGALAGYVSVVRAYDKTWWVQHLAADPGPHRAPYLLNMGAAELFGQGGETEYFKAAFFADNKWPARIFGRFARRIDDARVSVLRGFMPATLPLDLAQLTLRPHDGISVRDCEPDRLWLVERYFVRTRPDLLLRSDNLTKQHLLLQDLSARYAESRLDRGRRILLAIDRDRPVAFALVEHASPGFNLQEHFNSVRVHFLEPADAQKRQVLRSALLSRAIEVFHETGATLARVFLRSNEASEYAALGLKPGSLVLEWTCHRSQFRSFTDHVHRIFEALMARERARRARASKTVAPR